MQLARLTKQAMNAVRPWREQTRCTLLLLCWVLSACAGAKQERVGVSPTVETSQQEEAAPPPRRPNVLPTVVLDAARPYSGHSALDQQSLTADELFTTLATYDAVCLGERHDHAEDHFAQLEAIRAFGERQTTRGFEFGVAFEMVRQEFGLALRKYQQASIDRSEFLELSQWETEWGFSIHYYDPLFRAATQAHAPLVALGVDRALTRAVAESGVEGLPEDDAARLPELDMSNLQHRALFQALMSGHPGAEPMALDRFYEAQVIWDESMADEAARFLLARRPLGKLLIVAGVAHCHRSAIVGRLERRTGMQVTNLLVTEGKPAPGVGDSVEARVAAGYDYQLVFER